MIPKYGYCQSCRELFRWNKKEDIGRPYLRFCPNKYHDVIWSRILQPCWEIWTTKVWKKQPPKELLMTRCKKCDNRFICLTNGWADTVVHGDLIELVVRK